MTDTRIARIKSAKGAKRKEIEERLKAEVEAWLEGRDGNLCIGALYDEFFRTGG
ncbi:MAG: hypothetical protein JXQ91_07600 [Vannielia sp.]|uniref:hypothetical protein n=1 Tax=Vannielia sp. TaxID=2813045 RepID=UPI003B8C8BF3